MEKQITLTENLYYLFKPYLMALTFRMLGNLADSEEIVHETFLEFERSSKEEISNHKAWLTKVCTNKALNFLKSAYKQRVLYPGQWLPDAIPESLYDFNNPQESSSTEESYILSETLTSSFLILLENLSPVQRAVYLLSEVFDYSFKEIAELINKTPSTCRKIAQRARDAIRVEKKSFSPAPENAEEIILKLYEFARRGDRDGIKSILANDSEILGDGGGKVFAAGHITNLEDIVTFFVRLGSTNILKSCDYKLEYSLVNSRPGLIVSEKSKTGSWSIDTVLSYEFTQNKIIRAYAQRNPDKLKALLPKNIHRENIFFYN